MATRALKLKTGKPQGDENPCIDDFKLAYKLYFKQPDLMDEDYTPNWTCRNCFNNLMDWAYLRKKKLSFGVPMKWKPDPEGHVEENCYACRNYDEGKSKKQTKTYVSTLTATCKVLDPPGVEPPKPPNRSLLNGAGGDTFPDSDDSDDPNDPTYEPEPGQSTGKPIPMTQKAMDYLAARINLDSEKKKWLTDFLKEHHVWDRSEMGEGSTEATGKRNLRGSK